MVLLVCKTQTSRAADETSMKGKGFLIGVSVRGYRILERSCQFTASGYVPVFIDNHQLISTVDVYRVKKQYGKQNTAWKETTVSNPS
jgi:hypothetical protein